MTSNKKIRNTLKSRSIEFKKSFSYIDRINIFKKLLTYNSINFSENLASPSYLAYITRKAAADTKTQKRFIYASYLVLSKTFRKGSQQRAQRDAQAVLGRKLQLITLEPRGQKRAAIK